MQMEDIVVTATAVSLCVQPLCLWEKCHLYQRENVNNATAILHKKTRTLAKFNANADAGYCGDRYCSLSVCSRTARERNVISINERMSIMLHRHIA